MARPKNSDVNLSEEIRKYVAKHPDAGPKQIKEALAAAGHQVAPALISNVKTCFKPAQEGGKTPAPRTRRDAPSTNGSHVEFGSTSAQLVEARRFVKACGSLEKARQLLDEYEAFDAA